MPTKAKKHRPREKAKRPSAETQFYRRARWLNLAQLVRSHQGVCQDPDNRHQGESRRIECVDHIKPRSTHPHLEYEFDNLQGLCWSCHSAKTIREQKP